MTEFRREELENFGFEIDTVLNIDPSNPAYFTYRNEKTSILLRYVNTGNRLYSLHSAVDSFGRLYEHSTHEGNALEEQGNLADIVNFLNFPPRSLRRHPNDPNVEQLADEAEIILGETGQ